SRIWRWHVPRTTARVVHHRGRDGEWRSAVDSRSTHPPRSAPGAARLSARPATSAASAAPGSAPLRPSTRPGAPRAAPALKPARCASRRAPVLFCDVVGYTAMSERLDPEDVFALMEQTFGVILDAVHRQAGTVNQFLGDGAMALFDRPAAAIAAGLEILELL